MRIPNDLSDEEFQHQILQKVSRSFALTIPQLPDPLRPVVTNAYLLCRIADTIEDESSLTIQQKRFFFGELIKVVSNETSPEWFAGELSPLLSNQTPPGEKELVRNAPSIIHMTRSFTETQRALLKRCVTVMAAGMERFQKDRNPHGLRHLTDLDDYCYHVAGVVGELLTELFCDYSAEMSKNKAMLLKLAVSFGQGLQMTNILKDLWEDKERDACWLPQEVFQRVGFDLKSLSHRPYQKAFGEGLGHLIAIARAHLKKGLAYTLLIPRKEKGIREFCLWAIGMAIFTLRRINRKRYFRGGGEVKISRRHVRAIIAVTRWTLKSNSLLKLLFTLSGRGLPGPPRSL
jgi:farnesyl-diphosphate farnesyltransferase